MSARWEAPEPNRAWPVGTRVVDRLDRRHILEVVEVIDIGTHGFRVEQVVLESTEHQFPEVVGVRRRLPAGMECERLFDPIHPDAKRRADGLWVLSSLAEVIDGAPDGVVFTFWADLWSRTTLMTGSPVDGSHPVHLCMVVVADHPARIGGVTSRYMSELLDPGYCRTNMPNVT